jgi:3-dehydroquinate dehydratase-1
MLICHGAPIPIVKVGEMTSNLPKPSSVVGTIHSPAALAEARRLKAGDVDFLEVRVDHFVDDLSGLLTAIRKLAAPLIVTVRHPQEGGAAALSVARRNDLYRQFLPFAALIDIELRSAKALEAVLRDAKRAGICRILSWHDFNKTPSLAELQTRFEKAGAFAPEIIKFATRARTAKDLARLMEFQAGARRKPALSLMGMREFGKISRLALAQAGSVLNYGYLGELQVPGQWPARVLKERLHEIVEE